MLTLSCLVSTKRSCTYLNKRAAESSLPSFTQSLHVNQKCKLREICTKQFFYVTIRMPVLCIFSYSYIADVFSDSLNGVTSNFG